MNAVRRGHAARLRQVLLRGDRGRAWAAQARQWRGARRTRRALKDEELAFEKNQHHQLEARRVHVGRVHGKVCGAWRGAWEVRGADEAAAAMRAARCVRRGRARTCVKVGHADVDVCAPALSVPLEAVQRVILVVRLAVLTNEDVGRLEIEEAYVE